MSTPVSPSKPTGITATSTRLSLAGIVSGLGILITGYLQNTSGEATTAHSIVGGGLALGSIVAKLIHDGSFNRAALSAAVTSISADLPSWKADVSKAVSFVEEDLPGVKGLLSGLEARLATVEGKVTANIPDLSAIEGIVRQVLTEILAGQPKTP